MIFHGVLLADLLLNMEESHSFPTTKCLKKD